MDKHINKSHLDAPHNNVLLRFPTSSTFVSLAQICMTTRNDDYAEPFRFAYV